MTCNTNYTKCVTDLSTANAKYTKCGTDLSTANKSVVDLTSLNTTANNSVTALTASNQTLSANVTNSYKSDNLNCGGSGITCRNGQYCVDGKCTTSCPTGQKICMGVCKDTSNDPYNCGECGIMCSNGQYCVGGVCTSFPTPTPSCPTGQIRCGTQCVSTTNNLSNCGRCENVCRPGALCSSGNCVCPAGTADCSGSGCIDIKNNNSNCGSCGTACPFGQYCLNSVCTTIFSYDMYLVDTQLTTPIPTNYIASTSNSSSDKIELNPNDGYSGCGTKWPCWNGNDINVAFKKSTELQTGHVSALELINGQYIFKPLYAGIYKYITGTGTYTINVWPHVVINNNNSGKTYVWKGDLPYYLGVSAKPSPYYTFNMNLNLHEYSKFYNGIMDNDESLFTADTAMLTINGINQNWVPSNGPSYRYPIAPAIGTSGRGYHVSEWVIIMNYGTAQSYIAEKKIAKISFDFGPAVTG